MTSIKAMTLSMESLNKLYFQFFERFIVPNLSKQVNQITQLLRQKTAYEVHRFLQQTLSSPSDNYSIHNNQSLNSSTGSLNLSPAIPPNNYSYQYALPSQVEHTKNFYIDNSHAFDKTSDKHIQQGVSFKSKLNIRRVHTGLTYQDNYRPYDPFEYKHIRDDNLMTVPSLSSNSAGNEGLMSIPNLTTGLSSDFKIDFFSNKELNENKKSKIMCQQVKKISKVFNQGHSKIEKYSKNGLESQNKLFNLNVSTKLQKRDYSPYQHRPQVQSWKL